jgi:ABC-type nitrate/sulfonate/bicarbonate transport system substrate-binding protein
MRQQNAPIFIFLLTLILLLTASGLWADDREGVVWKVLVPRSTSSLPLLALDADDFPEGPGDALTGTGESVSSAPVLDVELFSNHAQALALLLRGQADMILTGTSQGWENHLGGGPLVMVDTGIWGVSSLIGRERRFNGFADLRSKTVAVPFPGSPLDVQMRVLLEEAGLDPARDIKIVYSPPAQTAARLLNGSIDAAPLPEPLASNLVLRGDLNRLIQMKDAWAGVSGGDPLSPQVSLFVTRSTVGSSRSDLEMIVRHWREASTWVTDHPSQAAGLFAPVLELPPDILTEAIVNTVYLVPEPEENARRVRAYFQTVRRFSTTSGDETTLAPEFFF